jgi:hypothetical protein
MKRLICILSLCLCGGARAIPPPFPGGFLLVHPDPPGGPCPQFSREPSVQYWLSGQGHLWRIYIYGNVVIKKEIVNGWPFLGSGPFTDKVKAYVHEPRMCTFSLFFDPKFASEALGRAGLPGKLNFDGETWYWTAP